MKTWFSRQDYFHKIIENEMTKLNSGESRSKTESVTGVLFAITQDLRLKAIGETIKNLNILHMNNEVKDTFTGGPMVSFRTARKLSSYLV